MYTYRLPLASSVFVLLMASPAFAADNAVPSQTTNKWAPELQIESDVGIGHNDRDIGLPQIMAPLWQNNDSMVFTDLRFRFDNEQSQEYNIGLGYRKEINSDWILGGYGFFDKLSSASGELYSQGTFGAEALSVNNDARINVYIPQSATHGAPGGGQVEVVGNQIGLANGAERALPGEDFELGQKLSFNFADVRIYGGAYRYTADNFGMMAGPRGRLELTLNDQYIPAIPFGAEVSLGGEIEHDDTRGTQQFVLLKLRIPLGVSSVHNSTNTLDQRMNTFIERDIDIVEKTGNGANGALQPVALNGNTIPYVTTVQAGTNLDSAVSAAPTNSLIRVNGAGGALSVGGNITMLSGQTLLGSGGTLALTAAKTGQAASYTYAGTTPTVNGGLNALITDNNNLINGINFSHLSGIYIFGSSGIKISNVNVDSSPSAVVIDGGKNIAISNLTVTNSDGYGIVLEFGTASNVSIANAQLNNTGLTGFLVDTAIINTLTYNNVQTNNNGQYGIFINGSTITGLSGSGNTSTGNGGSNCSVSSTVSGSITYNGSSTCP